MREYWEDYKQPDDPDVLPSADAFVVAPATFNTINKVAAGISDTLALDLINEGIGLGKPVLVIRHSPGTPLSRTACGGYRTPGCGS